VDEKAEVTLHDVRPVARISVGRGGGCKNYSQTRTIE